MLSGIANWVEDKATGYLRTGIQAGGTLAGNAVGGVGSLVENAGKSAASGVQGGIGGVGSYINGYGDSIKRSMSADGPTTTTQKKTAVKTSAPSTQTAKKALPSSQAPKKALPSTAPASKAPPVSAKKPPPPSKPAAPAQGAKSSITQKTPQSTTKLPPTGKLGGPTSVKPKGPVGVSKPTSTSTTSNAPKLLSSVSSSGKVIVSPESRPGYKKTAVGGAANKGSSTSVKQTSDSLGIGENFGDLSKARPNSGQTSQTKNSSAPARKPSAADPLALGEEIEKIGKKK